MNMTIAMVAVVAVDAETTEILRTEITQQGHDALVVRTVGEALDAGGQRRVR